VGASTEPNRAFTLLGRCPLTRARVGRLRLPRGEVETPVFMPVGTLGTVKALTVGELTQLGARLILANAYHLNVRPGSRVVRELGGLHRFMGWEGSILTDSGGYQVFSLGRHVRIREEGVVFHDPTTGDLVELTPERVIGIQADLGSDISMPLDQPVSYGTDARKTAEATDRSDRWVTESYEAFARSGRAADGALSFAIQQGGFREDLRARSAARLTEVPFDGYAIGGLSFGEPREITRELTRLSAGLLPEARPRYLMGVGMPRDIVEAVADGVDMFDCVLPTRLARHGVAVTSEGTVQLRNARWREAPGPLDGVCTCEACTGYPAAYLAHLVRCKEILGCRLLTIHNIHYYLRLMERVRESIALGTFADLVTEAASWGSGPPSAEGEEEQHA
jgi:queuine tRNA-ribosyltransferase